MERYFAVFNAHDLTGFAALHAPGCVLNDHRSMGWEKMTGRDAIATFVESAFTNVPDIRIGVDEVLAAHERVVALRYTSRGGGAHGSGEWELAVGQLFVIEDGQIARTDVFDHDDREGMLALYAELTAGGKRPPEVWHEEFARRWAALDLEPMLELYALDATQADHRNLSLWESRHDREGYREQFTSIFELNESLGFEIDEVIAGDDRVLAARVRWFGTVDGGDWTIDGGLVSLIEDGLCRSHDIYEPEDRAAVAARYAELGGGQGPLGDLPPERHLKKYIRCFAARDIAAMAELAADSFSLVDHRALGWGDATREAWIDWTRAAMESSPTLRFEVDEVLACDERVIAVRGTWCGPGLKAGPFEAPAGAVTVVEDGRWTSHDIYDPDDRDAMLARYAELSGRRESVFGDKPPERFWTAARAHLHAQDLDALRAVYDPAFVSVDHRKVGWEEVHDREGIADRLRSAFAVVPDIREQVDEVLACDDRVIAARGAWSGTSGEGGGSVEIPFGVVRVLGPNGWLREDLYEPGDRGAMMARYAELNGEGGSVPGASAAERFIAEYQRRLEAGDLDAVLELYAEDWRFTDHRQLSWEKARGREVAERMLRGAREVNPDLRLDVDEVLASDERVIALRFSWVGHGPDGATDNVLQMAAVCVIEDGLWRSCDQYEHDDRWGALHRYGELGGWPANLGHRPPEQLLGEISRHYCARDFDRLLALYAEDVVFVDRRPVGWQETHGREGLGANWRSGAEIVPDNCFTVDEVLACDDRVMAVRTTFGGHAADGGGEAAVQFGSIYFLEGGLCSRLELFDPDDRDAMLAHYAGLTRASPVGDRPTDHFHREFLRRTATGDLDSILDLYSDDVVHVDHRKLSWEGVAGKAEQGELIRSLLAMGKNLDFRVEEVLAQHDRVIAVACSITGKGGDGGGAFELNYGVVAVIDDDGRCAIAHQFEYDDRAAMLACYAELTAPALGPERFFAEYGRRNATHDVDHLLELFSPDYVLHDHRAMGYAETRGHDQVRRATVAGFAAFPDLSTEVDEVLACDERVIAMRWTMRGHATEDAGGGPIEIPWGVVAVVEDGLWLSADYYEPDDLVAIMRRYAQLGGWPTGLGRTPPERTIAELYRQVALGDLDAIRELYSEEVEFIDHRMLAWDRLSGRDAVLRTYGTAFEAVPDINFQIDECLACDGERLIALRYTFHGHATDGGGELELPFSGVSVVENGRFVRTELCAPEDEHAALTAYVAHGGRLGAPLGDLPSERMWKDWIRRYAAQDLDGLVAMLADDIVGTDHRELGWDPVAGREQMRDLLRSFFDIGRDVRVEVEEVLARTERVIAVRYGVRGSGTSGVGDIALDFGSVARVDEHGLVVSIDYYEPDDTEAILARFEELAGERPGPDARVLGARAPERFGAEFARRWAERDVGAIMELFTDDYALEDHRGLGWDSISGEDAQRELLRSGLDMSPDITFDVPEMLACDERVAAAVVLYHGIGGEGGGPFEIPLGYVFEVEDGRATRLDIYDPSDRGTMINRYVELGGGQAALGDAPPARWWRDAVAAEAARDADRFVELFAEDFTFTDHRPLGWDAVAGKQAAGELFRSGWKVASFLHREIDDVLACDERVIALRCTLRFENVEGGGRSEVPLGLVALIEDGLSVSHDQYDAGDTEAMLARFAELGGRPEDPLGDTPIERLLAKTNHTFNARDFDAHLALHAEDFVLVDHRPLGWGEAHGRDALAELVRSALSASDDVHFEIEDVLACDGERVIAGRGGWRSAGSRTAGSWEIEIGFVTVGEDGLLNSHDFYEPDDTDAVLARYAELSVAAADSPAARAFTETVRRFAAGDWDAIEALVTEDIVLVDRRTMSWDEVSGPTQVAELFRSVTAPGATLAIEPLVDDGGDVVMYRSRISGGGGRVGEWELVIDNVTVLRDGRIARLEQFDQADEEARIRRYEELRAGG